LVSPATKSLFKIKTRAVNLMKKQHGWLVKRLLIASLGALTALAQAEELTITGSGNPEVLLRAMAESFGRQQSAHSVSVPVSTGTAGALRDVQAGTVVLGRVGRPLPKGFPTFLWAAIRWHLLAGRV
jgi:ABC-type phosphate transport system substrate-binding protein